MLLAQVNIDPEKRVKLLKNPVVRVSSWFLRENVIHITSFTLIENTLDFPVIGSPKLIPTSKLSTMMHPVESKSTTNGNAQHINILQSTETTSSTSPNYANINNSVGMRTVSNSRFKHESASSKSPTDPASTKSPTNPQDTASPKPNDSGSQVSVVACLENMNLTKNQKRRDVKIKYYSMQIVKKMRHLLNESVWKCMCNDFRSESKRELISHIQQQHLKVS